MVSRILALAFAGSCALLVGSACGSSADSGFDDGSSGGSSGSSGDGTSGFVGSSGSSGASGSLGSSGSSGASSGDLGACGAETRSAEQLPVDLLIMLDASGSMMETTSSGGTKWAAVKSALASFVGDPKSAGIGVGLQIFPITHPGAPASCTSSAACTVGGASYGHCTTKACHPATASDPLVYCDANTDCPGAAACRQLGQCVLGPFAAGLCLKGDPQYDCPSPYTCQTFTSGVCDGDECFASDYAAAKVPIAALPGNAATLTSTVNAIPDPPPTALTPTSVAEQAGIDLAKAYAAAHPGHAVVVVLATDGLPTRCAPEDIPGIAAIAAAGASGSPSVKTFVIGVFSDDEAATATANLNAIAAGGGTTNAFIVSTSGNVTKQFQAALDTIRGTPLPCEYEVPSSEAGAPDYGKVNVQYTTGAGAKNVLGYKASAAACDAAGGWYYDVDPATGAVPTKIIVCPSTCDAIKKDTGSAKVEILLGCATIVK
jgi:hypothetical protein